MTGTVTETERHLLTVQGSPFESYAVFTAEVWSQFEVSSCVSDLEAQRCSELHIVAITDDRAVETAAITIVAALTADVTLECAITVTAVTAGKTSGTAAIPAVTTSIDTVNTGIATVTALNIEQQPSKPSTPPRHIEAVTTCGCRSVTCLERA